MSGYAKLLVDVSNRTAMQREFQGQIFWLQGRQHDFQSGGAKTQPIFKCYNFSFETLLRHPRSLGTEEYASLCIWHLMVEEGFNLRFVFSIVSMARPSFSYSLGTLCPKNVNLLEFLIKDF